MDKERQKKWDLRFLRLAEHISGWSKDLSTKCGAVITRSNRTVASIGYNGFPSLLEDRVEDIKNREVKYSKTVHAEMAAILHCTESLFGCTLYTWPFLSCHRCTIHVIQCGIVRCVSPLPSRKIRERWGDSLIKSRSYFAEAGIECVELDI